MDRDVLVADGSVDEEVYAFVFVVFPFAAGVFIGILLAYGLLLFLDDAAFLLFALPLFFRGADDNVKPLDFDTSVGGRGVFTRDEIAALFCWDSWAQPFGVGRDADSFCPVFDSSSSSSSLPLLLSFAVQKERTPICCSFLALRCCCALALPLEDLLVPTVSSSESEEG